MAQVNQTTWKGKTVNVYPFQAPVEFNKRFFNVLADSVEVIHRKDDNLTIESIEVVYNEESERYAAVIKKMSKQELANSRLVLEKYPFEWIDDENNLMKDITPALKSIPDGEYIQFFRDVPYVKNGVLRFRNDIVAGVFTIKNNVLEGNSVWFNPKGQVVREGSYLKGNKTGQWKQLQYDPNYPEVKKGDKNLDIDKLYSEVTYDTNCVQLAFLDGLKHGDYRSYSGKNVFETGSYLFNEPVGTWAFYAFKTEKEITPTGERRTVVKDELILKTRYTLSEETSRGKSVIFQDEIIPYEFKYRDYEGENSGEFFFNDTLFPYYNNDVFPSFSSFFTIEMDKDELDLPEERFRSFDNEEEMMREEYYPEMFDGGFTDVIDTLSRYDLVRYIDGKRKLLNDVIDSIGYHAYYEGDFERYHKNGQLLVKMTIENGVFKSVSPFYYDNGQIANEVVFIADSNLYVQRFYDYYGQKYLEIRQDAHGKVISKDTEESTTETIEIKGKAYSINFGEPTVTWSAYDELGKGVSTETLVMEELYKEDSTLAVKGVFNPTTRTLETTRYNLGKGIYEQEEAVFSEDFKAVTATQKRSFKNVAVDVVLSGVYEDYFQFMFGYGAKPDTTLSPQRKVLNWEQNFSNDIDVTLKVNNAPFNGEATVTSDKRRFKFKATDSKLVYHMPTRKRDTKMYHKAVKKYLKKGKISPELEMYVPDFGGYKKLTASPLNLLWNFSEVKSDYSGSSSYNYDVPFMPLLSEEEMYMSDYYMNDMFMDESGAQVHTMTGKYVNGKPDGLWIGKDAKGKVIVEIPYLNGERNGTIKRYNYAYPKSKPSKKEKRNLKAEFGDEWEMVMQEMEYNEMGPAFLHDSLPNKKTYFLENVVDVKNGENNGLSIQMNWLGDTLNYATYVNGYQEGLSYERNKLFYTESYYENGAIDGITRTFLTPAGKDSVLLFELNFQNGELQGQSLAYHANGKIAKKGFFLSGKPIDDYEAYDTLGFRYQYVKFQYNQPIEEKIWEENQLSVRYQFDWKDSIRFEVGDITSATSIDRMIYDLGIDDGSMYAPYYGRPSLVSKGGINYTMTKYYPNDTIAREGFISKGKKVGHWNYYNYQGEKLMKVNYFDSLLVINDTLKFNSKGIVTYVDKAGNELSKSYIIEKVEKYDCSHSDHNEERMLYGFWERDSSQHRINGYVKNYYDNGSLMNEGRVENGLPVGIWKLYDVNANLSQVGVYVNGKRDGRWLKGDLGSVKNMSEICLNPNLENLEEILKYQEKLLDISVVYYRIGKEIRSQYYGVNLNNEEAPEGFFEEEGY